MIPIKNNLYKKEGLYLNQDQVHWQLIPKRWQSNFQINPGPENLIPVFHEDSRDSGKRRFQPEGKHLGSSLQTARETH